MLFILLSLLLIQGCINSFVAGQFLLEPVVRLNRTLAGDTSFRHGNGIVTDNNSNHVVVTTGDGRLFITTLTNLLSGNDTQSDVLVYTPKPIDTVHKVVCRSNPVLVEKTNGTSYVIYSIVDTRTNNNYTSRVLAVKVADASLLWQVVIPGKAVGTPMLGSNQRNVYVVHNIFDTAQQEDDGRISIITIEKSRKAKLLTTLPSASTGAPFTPGTFRSVPRQQQQQQGQRPGQAQTTSSEGNEMVDFVFFGERRQDGTSTRGSLYALVVNATATLQRENTDSSVMFVLLSDYPGSGVAAPAVSSSLDVYLGIRASYLLGYTETRDFMTLLEDSTANTDDDTTDPTGVMTFQNTATYPLWIVPLTVNSTDETAPIPVQPILSSDEQYIYVVAAGNELACVAQSQGNTPGVTWSFTTNGEHLSTPVFQNLPDGTGSVVYFIERETGIVRQFDSVQGTLNWQGSVGTPVEADFSIAGNGGLLLYGDVSGQIVVLQVATVETASPTPGPTSLETSSPSTPPTTKKPQKVRTEAPSQLRGGTANSKPTKNSSTDKNETSTTKTNTTGSNEADDESGDATTSGTNSTTNSTVSSVSTNEGESKSAIASNLPLILAAACGAVLVMILIALFMHRRRRRNNKGNKPVVMAPKEVATNDPMAEADRLYELEKMKIALECEQDERETLDAIIALSAPKHNNSNTTTETQPMDESIGSQSAKEADGFEVSADDYSVTESIPDMTSMTSMPSVYSETLLSPVKQDIPETISQIHALTPTSSGGSPLPPLSLSPRRESAPVLSLTVPSLLPSLSATPSRDEIDTLALSPSQHSMKSDQSDSFIAKVAAVLTAPSMLPRKGAESPTKSISSSNPGSTIAQTGAASVVSTSVASPRMVSPRVVPLDAGSVLSGVRNTDNDDDDEMEGFSSFMGEGIETPQPSRHRRPNVQMENKEDPPLPISSPLHTSNLKKADNFKSPVLRSPKQRAGSPTPSESHSVDDSLYMDESTIAEADIGAGAATSPVYHDDILESPTSRMSKIDELGEDEPPAVLKPGSHYLERHTRKTATDLSVSDESRRSTPLDPNKVKPMYKGVSVRPSRAKAGIFSRRMPPRRHSNSDDEAIPTTPKRQVEPIVPPTKLVKKKPDQPEVPLVQPTPASYYVEEHERNGTGQKSGEKNGDPKSEWNSFLQELSMAENQFYAPVSPKAHNDDGDMQPRRAANLSPKRRGLNPSAPLSPGGQSSNYDSDSSREAPPPPRTFYA